jgi:hypothetical protein
MKSLNLFSIVLLAVVSVAVAGSEGYSGKEMKQVQPAPCPEWYGDKEWNVNLWGTYAFTGENWENDRYIEADHAWGGGLDIKYFFHRYFGVGVEGWAVEATRQRLEGIDVIRRRDVVSSDSRPIGSALGTLTLRYPFRCSRISPYLWAGGGAIFGGGEREFLPQFSIPEFFTALHSGSQTKAVGQFGGGLEVRVTPHIGFMSDFSWNVVDGPNNNFGMARTGLTFAF